MSAIHFAGPNLGRSECSREGVLLAARWEDVTCGTCCKNSGRPKPVRAYRLPMVEVHGQVGRNLAACGRADVIMVGGGHRDLLTCLRCLALATGSGFRPYVGRGNGGLLCEQCGRPLAEHRLTERHGQAG